jgi:trimeric autotransporter adhesin
MSSTTNFLVESAPLSTLSTPNSTVLGNSATLSTSPLGQDSSLQTTTFPSSSSAPDVSSTSIALAPLLLGTGGTTFNSATNLGSLSSTQTIQDTLGVSNSRPNSYYRFTLNTTSNLNLVMTGLTADADLYLLNSAGTQIATSGLYGYTQDESINLANVAAGTYYIRVNQWQGNTGFTLNLSTNALSNLLSDEFELNSASWTSFTQTGTINSSNTSDTYHFSNTYPSANFNITLTGLSADADLRVIRDANQNGIVDAGEEIIRSAQFGSASESINLQGLGTGDYFIQVYQYTGNTNYTLTLDGLPGLGSALEFNNTLNQAYDLGTLNGTRQFDGFVGTTPNDPQDFYRFSLGTTSNFSLSLSGLSADANVEVIRDSNNNGIVDVGEWIAWGNTGGIIPEFLEIQGLGAGDYFVRVLQAQSGTNTNYNLTLQATPGLGLPGGQSWGGWGGGWTVNGSREFGGSISDRRPNDWYYFDLSTTSTLNLNLSGLTGDLNVYLYQDRNGDGGTDDNEVIARGISSGSLSELISSAGLAAGRYFVRVSQAVGATGNIAGSYSNYVLSLEATPLGTSFNNTYGSPSQALNLGFLGTGSRSRSFNGFVNSSDPQDYYRFTVDRSGTLNLSLDRLSADADVEILSSNGSVVARSAAFGTTPEQLLANLTAGDYYVRVYQASGNTNYTANLNFTPFNLLF